MTLENDLREVLAEQADRHEAPPVDLDAVAIGATSLRRRHRNRVTLAATGAVIVAVAVGGIVAWGLQEKSRTGGVAPLDDRTNDPTAIDAVGLHYLDLETGQRTPAEGFTSAANYVFSPDGSRVVCSGRCFGTTGPLVVADADGSHPVALDVPAGADGEGNPFDAEPQGVRWSPDGSTLLYTLTTGQPIASNIQDLILHDVARNQTRTLVDFGLHDRSFYGLGGFDFSPDGAEVVYSRPRRPAPCTEVNPETPCTAVTDFDLWSVPSIGGEPVLELRNVGVPGYLADGQGVVFVDVGTNAWDGGSISIASSGVRRTLVTTPTDVWQMEMSPDRSKLLYLSEDGITVVDVTTGETSHLYGNHVTWAGDDRLLLACAPGAPAPDEEPTVDGCS